MLEEPRSTAEVADLFDVAGDEDEAISELDGCVARLRQVQAAKLALADLSGTELRAALELRRRRGYQPHRGYDLDPRPDIGSVLDRGPDPGFDVERDSAGGLGAGLVPGTAVGGR